MFKLLKLLFSDKLGKMYSDISAVSYAANVVSAVVDEESTAKAVCETSERKKCNNCLRYYKIDNYTCPHCGGYNYMLTMFTNKQNHFF